ncbi:MAG: hypothetical protein AAB456_00825 [Patescibacteria group bacterium]
MEQSKFMELVDKICVMGMELKKERASMEDSQKNHSKQTKEEEFKLIHAKEDFTKTMEKQTLALNEALEKSKIATADAKKKKEESDALLIEAKNKNAAAEAALTSANAKEQAANSLFIEAQKLKDELQIKVEKARQMAQSFV